MANRDPGYCPRNAAMLDMQIAGANAGECHFDNSIPLLHQGRFWLLS